MSGRQPALQLLLWDAEVVALNKPAGLSVTDNAREFRAAVLAALVEAGQELQPRATLEPTHRIDKQATGVVLLARTARAFESLIQQFEEGRATCLYEALVLGYVIESSGAVTIPLIYDKRAGKMRTHPERGRAARTAFRVLERVAGHTLLECIPMPGLVHQVRVHVAAMGHPLAIDPLYGGGERVLLSSFKSGYRPSSRREERPLIERLSQHLAEVRFEHPVNGAPLRVRAPRPRDLDAAVTQLARQM